MTGQDGEVTGLPAGIAGRRAATREGFCDRKDSGSGLRRNMVRIVPPPAIRSRHSERLPADKKVVFDDREKYGILCFFQFVEPLPGDNPDPGGHRGLFFD